jgi:enolase
VSTIKSITFRKVLNSHVEFTNEFVVELDDGSIGIGGSPQGETISIYEDKTVSIDPQTIIQTIARDGLVGRSLEQAEFDHYLQERIPTFGRNNAFGLSLAFFNATSVARSLFDLFGKEEAKLRPPRICCNILNGGWHAYTNPVLSDFSEYILVSRSNDLKEVVENHNEIQRVVKEKLLNQTKTVVSGNPVNRFATTDNRECIEFLLNVRDSLGFSEQFDLMIDASGGDLWTDEGYRLAITDGSVRSSEEFGEYWLDIIRQYNLKFLEDPFREQDTESWQHLTTLQQACHVIGDNFYSSDPGRIEAGATKKHTHGAIIKPNQAGTVTAVRQAIEAAQRTDQIAITSHRSISTESTFLSTLTCMYGVNYIKIGPLITDYSSVVRLNAIIRLTGA